MSELADSPTQAEIKGYKKLTAEDLHHLNGVKELEKIVLQHLKRLGSVENYSVDKRWLSIARTNMEQGFMAACRAIAQPETVEF